MFWCYGNCKHESGNKRKGSPFSKADLSEGGAVGTIESERKSSLRRQNSVPDLYKMMVSAKDKMGGGGIAFFDMVQMIFSEPTFAKSITPLLYDMMSQLILKTIETSVAATVEAAVKSVQSNVVDKMVESNNKLQESVYEQTRVIPGDHRNRLRSSKVRKTSCRIKI